MHPCRKCWDRYSKPYRGAIAYAPTTGQAGNFQRPLPVFTPPQQQPIGPDPARSAGVGPGPGPGPWSYPGQSSSSLNRAATVSYTRAPPRGALVVSPGDSRIGGRLCWQCDGSGTIGFFLFEETCPSCRGTGRIL